jgi:hypothetical protein
MRRKPRSTETLSGSRLGKTIYPLSLDASGSVNISVIASVRSKAVLPFVVVTVRQNRTYSYSDAERHSMG